MQNKTVSHTHTRKLKRIQRVATNMVPELRDLMYEEKLKEMGLPTLQDRKERGYLITSYKIVNAIEKFEKQDFVVMNEKPGQTRGHSKKIRRISVYWTLRSTVQFST